jgi:hypothetical protein
MIFSSFNMSSNFVLLFAIDAATAALSSATWGSTISGFYCFFDFTKLLKSVSTSSMGAIAGADFLRA